MNRRDFIAGTLFGITLPASAQSQIDIGLILMSDISSSVNTENKEIQLEGIKRAFAQNRIHNSLKEWNVAVCYGEWGRQAKIGNWYHLNSVDNILAFIDSIKPMNDSDDATCVAHCLQMVKHKIDTATFKPDKWIIDISGDGKENLLSVEDVHIARDNLLEMGDVTINGLPIIASEKDIVEWYKEHVIGGPGAFVLPSNGHQNFIDAIFKKLLREIG